MGIKVLAGDWEPGTVCVFEAAIFGKPDRIRMARVFGPAYPANEVVSIDIVTEQNSTSILKKAGWGFVGSVALGPLGLLAGVLGGGNRHEKIVAIEFTDGKRALLQCDTKSYGEMMRLTFRKKSVPPRPDASHALPSGFRKSVEFSPDPRIETAPAKAIPEFMNGVTVSFGPKSAK
ncbi:hypothetical protein [Agrobacterium larrymoorei]|uniref:Uncharacterized protein n=1 Tax=Agrobacterium larrymoorei TaxID=160699 RepID=A0AAF0H5Z6_9HYPH|nr:hypothetical protein [Agrobacterium larrymoorei]WHA40148.1 hypothetical protein CFBP5477_009900 [Agrobacterium larrymoorei]